MSIDRRWLVDNRVIFIYYQGDISAEEMHHSTTITSEMIQSSPEKVHLLVDARELGQVPLRLNNIRNSISMVRQKNLGWIVMVSDSRVTEQIAKMSAGITGLNLKIVHTVEAGIEFLNQVDKTLDTITIQTN